MSEYIGVNNIAREIKEKYVGINGVAREVQSEYLGVNNLAREVFTSRDLSKNMWRVVSLAHGGSSTNSMLSTVGSTFTPLSEKWLYSSGAGVSEVTLCSTIKFLRGDTFKITFFADLDLSEEEEKFNDAYGQMCFMTAYNSNDTSNSASASLRTEIERGEQTVNLIMTSDGYLRICLSLESCGENYISSSVNIKINDIKL